MDIRNLKSSGNLSKANDSKGIPKSALLLIIWNVLRIFPFNYFWIIRATYLTQMGMDAATVAFLQIVMPIIAMIFILPFSILSNKFGWKKFIFLGTILDVLVLFIYALFSGFWWFITSSVLEGFANALLTTPSTALLSVLAGEKKLTRVYSLSSSLIWISGVPATFMSAIPDIMQVTFGFNLALANRLMFWIALPPVIISLFLLLPIPEVKLSISTKIFPKEHRGIVTRFSIYQVLMGCGAGLIIPLTPLWLFYRFNVGAWLSSLIFGVGDLITGLAFLINPKLERKVGTAWSVVGTQSIGIILLFFIPLGSDLITVSLLYITRYLFMNLTTPMQTSFIMRSIPDEARATVGSIAAPPFGLAWTLPWTGSQYLGGRMIEQGEFTLQFIVAAFLYILGTSSFALFFRRSKTPDTTSSLGSSKG